VSFAPPAESPESAAGDVLSIGFMTIGETVVTDEASSL
jgi:hypothetical protein